MSKVHRFKIVKVTQKSLEDDNQTITEEVHYEAYYCNGLLGWTRWGECAQGYKIWYTEENAMRYIRDFMIQWTKENKAADERAAAKKRLKEELKTVREETGVYRFESTMNGTSGCLIKE